MTRCPEAVIISAMRKSQTNSQENGGEGTNSSHLAAARAAPNFVISIRRWRARGDSFIS